MLLNKGLDCLSFQIVLEEKGEEDLEMMNCAFMAILSKKRSYLLASECVIAMLLPF